VSVRRSLTALLLLALAFAPVTGEAQSRRRKKRPAVEAPSDPATPSEPAEAPKPEVGHAPDVSPATGSPPSVDSSSTASEKVSASPEPIGRAPREPPPRRPGPCREGPNGIPLDPVRTTYASADFGSPRRPCARTELGVVTRASGLWDLDREYHALEATLIAEAGWAVRPRLELSAAAELLRYQSATSGALAAHSFGLGQLVAGASYLLLDEDSLSLAASGRLLVPTSMLSPRVRTAGVEVGVPAAYTLTDALFLHGYAGLGVTGGLGAGPLLPRLGLQLTAGAEYHPLANLAVAADLTARFATHAPLEELTPAVALRYRAARRVWLELAASLPVAGEHGLTTIDTLRIQPLGTFRVSYRP